MKKLALLCCLVISASLLFGCKALPNYQGYEVVPQPFDNWQAQRLLSPGNNTLDVRVFSVAQSGYLANCDGYQVQLIPATSMADERISNLYGSALGGFKTTYFFFPPKHAIYDPRYDAMTKTAPCGPNGRVMFTNVADGEFYVTAYNDSNIASATRVTVRGGEAKEVMLMRP